MGQLDATVSTGEVVKKGNGLSIKDNEELAIKACKKLPGVIHVVSHGLKDFLPKEDKLIFTITITQVM